MPRYLCLLRGIGVFHSVVTGFIVFTGCACVVFADELPDSPRVTPLVRVINKLEPAVVSLFAFPKNQMVAGSGAIIHPDGFVLTNNHVLPVNQGFALLGSALPSEQQRLEYVVVGRNPERDIAIVKLKGNGPYPTIPLGRSNDLLNGESVIVAGNPGGRGLVFSSGIISARMVLAGMPNAFVMTHYKNSRRPKFIQFDAASNGGNSGGPLINLEGRQIGIVSAKVYQEQNVGFAIPIDDVFELIEGICEPELICRKSLGITLNLKTPVAEIASVAPDSAAATAGLKRGDQIRSLNGRTVRNKIDWYLLLRSMLSSTDTLAISVDRAEERQNVQLIPTPLPPTRGVDVQENELELGLRYRVFEGQFSLVPDFTKLDANGEGVLTNVNLEGVKRTRNDFYAVEASGFLKAPADGLYRIVVVSDDGSNLYLHDELLIDNDGNHAPQGVGKLVYLKAGFHPLRLGYFQGNGGSEMQLLVEQLGHEQKQAAGDMVWHRPADSKSVDRVE